MKISSDDQKAISVILFFTGLLFFLLGVAARLKENFHSRAAISAAGFIVAAALAALGLIVLLLSLRKKGS